MYDYTNAPSGTLIEGETYRVATPSGDGTVTYNAILYENNDRFVATNITDYTTTGDAEVMFQAEGRADGVKLFNNVFLNCGDSRTNYGWYGILTNLTNVAADFNYVGKSNYAAVKEDPLQRPVGGSNLWDYMNSEWWEPNGINGGDAGFINVTNLDFRLKTTSQLLGAATNLNGIFSHDILRRTRP